MRRLRSQRDGQLSAVWPRLEAGEGERIQRQLSLVKRRVSSPIPATNLGALRALANETARMAISRHELRKHRRNAVTKLIVATLAGLTSLWLMLDSPDWYSVQFVTACRALLVAAYWAGETYRTLFDSIRAKSYDGPEAARMRPRRSSRRHCRSTLKVRSGSSGAPIWPSPGGRGR